MAKQAQLRQLVMEAPGIPPHILVNDVADMFMDESHGKLLSLPVLDGDKPVGVISRARMQQVVAVKGYDFNSEERRRPER